MAKRLFWVVLLIAVMSPAALADKPTSQSAPVKLTAEQDHRRLMNLLGIKSIPPGANGQHPNYDESIANPYPNLPDPLTLNNGQKVTTADMWWQQRRPELVEIFDREIYGRVPKVTPAVKWEVASVNNDGKTVTKKLIGHVDNSSYPQISVNIQVTLVTPTNATGPVPVMMQFYAPFNFGAFRRGATRPGTTGPAASRPGGFGAFGGFGNGPNWMQVVLAKGWGYATINTASIQADNGGPGLTQGIIGLCNKGQPRSLDDWGALRAWAWGASRALDYFETDKDVDAKHVGVEGHSRWGKTTLIAMAYDQRFAIAYVSSSGEGGAKLHRRNWGELVENIAGSGEYHWMAGNFIKYAGHWNDLPIDSHELIALCAPRPVMITGGTQEKGDGWVDAKGMFMAAAAAGPVYKLLGKRDLGLTEMPPLETALIDGDIAFRQHNGGHTDALDWPWFIQFASRYMKGSPVVVN